MKCDGRIINCYWLIGVVPAVVEVEVATKNTKCTNSGSYQKIDRRSMLFVIPNRFGIAEIRDLPHFLLLEFETFRTNLII